MKSINVGSSPFVTLIDEYKHYLLHVAGLQPATVRKWSYLAGVFLDSQRHSGSVSAAPLRFNPHDLLEFVLRQRRRYSPGQLQSLGSALRSFCRFLYVSGRQSADLSAALPAISGYHREDLPPHLSPAQLQRLLQAFERRTVRGKRDYAAALCFARLGLRAGEAAGLSLDDVDWRRGLLLLRAPKGRRQRELPLSDEVGRALAAYLRASPPANGCRAIFRSVGARRPLTASALSARVGVAMARAGLGPSGPKAHLLRRTFATHLVQRGASLKAVADLLGHTSLATTQLYAKVNLPMLRAVARPWPTEVER